MLADPFGCYDVSRYDGDHERMIREVMSVFEPSGFEAPSVLNDGLETIALQSVLSGEARRHTELMVRS